MVADPEGSGLELVTTHLCKCNALHPPERRNYRSGCCLLLKQKTCEKEYETTNIVIILGIYKGAKGKIHFRYHEKRTRIFLKKIMIFGLLKWAHKQKCFFLINLGRSVFLPKFF